MRLFIDLRFGIVLQMQRLLFLLLLLLLFVISHRTDGYNLQLSLIMPSGISSRMRSSWATGTTTTAMLYHPPSPSCSNSRGGLQVGGQQQLSMHMGHSHSHHHHDHHDHNNVPPPSTAWNRLPILRMMSKGRVQLVIISFLFSAMTILLPKLLRPGGRVAKADISVFGITAISLCFLPTVTNSIQSLVRKIRNLVSAISKHSTAPSMNFFRSESAADRVTLMGGVMNLILSLGKFAVGVTCNSSALIADAGHSLSDLFSDFVTLWAVAIGRLPPDEDHPYGHGKFEAIGSLFLSLTLFGTGIGIGAVSNKKLLEILALQRNGNMAGVVATSVPGIAALVMAGISVVTKEWLYRITKNVGERLNSQVVIANAWHHRSDAYSSVLAVASIGLAIAVPNLVFLDAAAGLLVAGMICLTGAEILGISINQLTDTSNDEIVRKVTKLAMKNDDVERVVRVRARQVGSGNAVDLSVAMPEDRAASAARAVEERLRQQILQKHSSVKDVEVKAVAPTVICPLLESRNENLVSTAEVESCVRDEIQARHPEVESVEGVTVRYVDSNKVDIDVSIQLERGASTTKARNVAKGLRATLERSNQINDAKIFLDLNENVTARMP